MLTIKQRTSVSTTESTLILSGSSPDTRGSWPIRKFAYKMEQTIRQSDGSKTETTLSSVDTRGSWPIFSNSQYFASKVAPSHPPSPPHRPQYGHVTIHLYRHRFSRRKICNHHTTIFINKLALGQRCIV